MKKLNFFIFALTLLTISANAQQKVRFMPHWTPQAQFAGYYVAKELGFYEEAGLDVEIKHVSTSSTRSSMNYMLYNEVDITTQQLIPALVERSNGNKIVNIFQTSQNCSLMLVSHNKIDGIQSISGMKIGRWKSGFSEIAEMFINDYSIDVRWVPFINNISLYVSGAIDATLAYSYSEYLGIVFATGGVDKDHTIRFSELGYNYPEDGLYVTENYYNNNSSTIYKFITASKKGWLYAHEHPQEAVDIVMKYARENNIATNSIFQKMMLEEVLKSQIDEETGTANFKKLDEVTFNNLLDELYSLDYLLNPVTYKEFVK